MKLAKPVQENKHMSEREFNQLVKKIVEHQIKTKKFIEVSKKINKYLNRN
jgi:hypothetical protein